MKIVIDIDEELYKNKKGYLTTMDAHMICDAVAKGTPITEVLDKIKAEIEAEKIEGFAARNGGLEIALKIIDKYKREQK